MNKKDVTQYIWVTRLMVNKIFQPRKDDVNKIQNWAIGRFIRVER